MKCILLHACFNTTKEILLTNTYPRKGKLHVHLLILKFIYEFYEFYFVWLFVFVVVVVFCLVFVVVLGFFLCLQAYKYGVGKLDNLLHHTAEIAITHLTKIQRVEIGVSAPWARRVSIKAFFFSSKGPWFYYDSQSRDTLPVFPFAKWFIP